MIINKLKLINYFFSIIFIVFFLFNSPSLASRKQSQMGVTANVIGYCSAEADDINFGQYSGDLDIFAQIEVKLRCSRGIEFTIAIDDRDSNYDLRNGNSSLPYEIYRDATYKTRLGGSNVLNGTTTGLNQDVIIYAKIPKGQQDIAQGFYSDYIPLIFSTVSLEGTEQDLEYRVRLNVGITAEKI